MSLTMSRIAVYLGSRDGADPSHGALAVDLGQAMAGRGIDLVYGGGSAGLMGVVSQSVLDAGGRVHGVIPTFMVDREWARDESDGVTMEIVDSMHVRKARMAELADAFLVVPGGLGTLEELFEVWTWQVLGLHRKPIGLLSPAGFWDPLLAMVERVIDAGFADRHVLDDLVVADSIDRVLDGLAAWR